MTNTFSVGTAAASVKYMLEQNEEYRCFHRYGQRVVTGVQRRELNDIQRVYVTEDMYWKLYATQGKILKHERRLRNRACAGVKGGINSASRIVDQPWYNIGVYPDVQLRSSWNLRIDGKKIHTPVKNC